MILTIPEVLREKLGPEGARALAELLNEADRQTRERMIAVVEERFERRLTDELGRLRLALRELEARLDGRMSALENRLSERMGSLETRLTERMGAMETRLLRWTFAFWIGQFAVLLGILFAFFRS